MAIDGNFPKYSLTTYFTELVYVEALLYGFFRALPP